MPVRISRGTLLCPALEHGVLPGSWPRIRTRSRNLSLVRLLRVVSILRRMPPYPPSDALVGSRRDARKRDQNV
jgi:hypothetical protein